MGYSLGWDTDLQRDIGYGVPTYCEHPQCWAEIDRGMSYACGGAHDAGCGRFFCGHHLLKGQKCSRCNNSRPPYPLKEEHPDWTRHKATDPSWAEWREENGIKSTNEKGTTDGKA